MDMPRHRSPDPEDRPDLPPLVDYVVALSLLTGELSVVPQCPRCNSYGVATAGAWHSCRECGRQWPQEPDDRPRTLPPLTPEQAGFARPVLDERPDPVPWRGDPAAQTTPEPPPSPRDRHRSRRRLDDASNGLRAT